MDINPRMHIPLVWCVFVVCCEICRGAFVANDVIGFGGNTTIFTCSSPDINPGDRYVIKKDGTVFYRDSNEGSIVDGKYDASTELGEINLSILNTNISDAGVYACNHNFIDASGTISVAFRPESVTATTFQLDDSWQLSVTVSKVFPFESNISSVSCFRPENTVVIFQRENQEVKTNNEEQYLYDIFWNGTFDNPWSGDAQCNITIVVIDTIVRTINVSFQDTTTSTSSTSNRTSATVPPTLSTTTQIIQNTTDLTPDVCWCKITPWWWCIILIIFASIGGVGGVGTLGYWKYKGEINLCGKPRKWPCGSGKHNDDNSNSSVSQVKMDVMSTEKSDVDHKELSRNNSGNETSRETIPPRRTIHDENQGNGQSIRANGPNALPPITGYSKVRPDDNQFSGDPDKNTPNNEANYTPRPLTILPNIR